MYSRDHPTENVAYTYDQTSTGYTFGIGRLTSVSDAAGSLIRNYDERGNLLSEQRVSGSTTLTTVYTYDGASRIASMAYPDGTLVGYQHDAAGYVSGVTAKLPGASATTTIATVTHQPFGPISGATYGNGIAETWAFDQAYRPKSITDALSGTNLQNLTYGYDLANNVKTITDGVNAANSQTFGYDTINRLTSAMSGAGGYGTFGWKYDNVGNRLEQSQGTTTTTYGYVPGSNRLLTISSGTKTAQVGPKPMIFPRPPAGGYFWANAPPPLPVPVQTVPVKTLPRSTPPVLSGFVGWPILLTGLAGVFAVRKRLRSHRLIAVLSFAAILTGSATLITGCVSGSNTDANTVSGTTPINQFSFGGVVHGGQQPVSGATIQLYAVGTTGDASAATALLKSTVLTTASGSFSVTSDYTCPSATTQVYLVATGGNPGLTTGTNNAALAMMSALGSCGSLSASTYVSVNELTTVASLAALYPYMSSISSLGSADSVQLAAAFAVVNEYANIGTGTVPGPALPSGYYAASVEIRTLGDAVASCINSNGAVATGTPCGILFSLATPSGGSAPTDTISALLDILKNPTQNVAGILGLVSTSAPFEPTLPSPPASWSLPIQPLPAAPTFSVAGGTYSGILTVALASATGTTVYYTTDGATPSTASHKYSGELTIASTETLNAIAVINPYVTSPTATAAYILSGGSSSSSTTVVTNLNGNITGVPSADGTYYLTYTYNNANRPASVTGGALGATFVYDWAGQRYSKTNGGLPPTVYSYGQDGAVIAENDGGIVTDYIYVDGRPIAEIQPSTLPAANQINYVLADRLGIPQQLVNSSGNVVWSTTYQPFGTTGVISSTVNQDLRLPGQITDGETGFSYNLNRDYMPNLGRYLQFDPIGMLGGSNPYTYVTDNPTAAIDRIGLDASPAGEMLNQVEAPYPNTEDQNVGNGDPYSLQGGNPDYSASSVLQGLFPAHTAAFCKFPIGGSPEAQLEYANHVNALRNWEVKMVVKNMSLPEDVPFWLGWLIRQGILQIPSLVESTDPLSFRGNLDEPYQSLPPTNSWNQPGGCGSGECLLYK